MLTVNGNLSKTTSCSFAHNNGLYCLVIPHHTKHYFLYGTWIYFYDITNSNTSGAGLMIGSDIGILNELGLSANSILNIDTADIRFAVNRHNTARVGQIPSICFY
jgi:hypothetical protein